jgi:hypothetical protein
MIRKIGGGRVDPKFGVIRASRLLGARPAKAIVFKSGG